MSFNVTTLIGGRYIFQI